MTSPKMNPSDKENRQGRNRGKKGNRNSPKTVNYSKTHPRGSPTQNHVFNQADNQNGNWQFPEHCQNRVGGGQRSSPISIPPSTGMRSSPVISDDSCAQVYAGAKFHDPPSPKVLPKPPSHWMSGDRMSPQNTDNNCQNLTSHLKMMLNVKVGA